MEDNIASNMTLIKQSEVMLALLARLSIGIDQIRTVVTDKKRDPTAYVKAYNALTGSIGVTEVAKIARADKSNMSKVLKRWEAEGIVYDIGSQHKPFYKRVLVLPET